MELATALVTHFHPFSNSISLDGNDLDDALDASLAAFTADVEAAVPSYLGMQLTILQNGYPVTLTRITPHRTATTSLRIPLTVFGPRFDLDSRVTLYATTAGAFVDLAADLSYALHVPTSTDRSTDAGSSEGDDRRHGQIDGNQRITLDADVPPNPPFSGVSGLSELERAAVGLIAAGALGAAWMAVYLMACSWADWTLIPACRHRRLHSWQRRAPAVILLSAGTAAVGGA